METREKISKLRRLMEEQGIDAYIVPSADPHQSEYPANRWKTRAWLSGFGGSAGTVVTTQKWAGLWTDPRYHIRGGMELAGSGIELFKYGVSGVPSYGDWLYPELKEGSVIGFDGTVVSISELKKLKIAFRDKSVTFVTQHDLAGKLWPDRPGIPTNPIVSHDDKFSGESRISKIRRIREKLTDHKVDVHLLTMLDEIAWTFNIRGNDVEYNPVAISYAVISQQETRLFIQSSKVPADVKTGLEKDGVAFSEYEEIFAYIQKLPVGINILIDPDKTSCALGESIPENCQIKEGTSIPHAMKAIKNHVELEGIRKSQIRDGATD